MSGSSVSEILHWKGIESELAEQLICASTEDDVVRAVSRALETMGRWRFFGAALTRDNLDKSYPWFCWDSESGSAFPEELHHHSDKEEDTSDFLPEDWRTLVYLFDCDLREESCGSITTRACAVDHPVDEFRVFLVAPAESGLQQSDNEAAMRLARLLRGSWKQFGCIGDRGATALLSRSLMDASTELIQRVDPQGCIQYVNQTWIDAMRMQREEVVGTSVFEYIHPSTAGTCREHFGSLMEGDAQRGVSLTFLNADGEVLALKGNCVPARRHGKIIGVDVFMKDLTAERELQERNQTLQAALDTLDQPLVAFDAAIDTDDRERIYANGSFRRGMKDQTAELANAAKRALERNPKSVAATFSLDDGDTKWKVSQRATNDERIKLVIALEDDPSVAAIDTGNEKAHANCLAAAFDSCPAPMAVFDTGGALRASNREWSRIFGDGNQPGEAWIDDVNETNAEGLGPITLNRLKAGLQAAEQGKDTCFEIWTPDCGGFDSERAIKLSRLPDAELSGLWMAALLPRDLGDATLNPTADAANEFRVRLDAIEASPEGVAVLKGGLYTYMNPAHANIYGYKASELQGKSWRQLYSEKEQKRIETEAFHSLEMNGRWSGLATGLRKNGSTFDAEVALTVLASGELICCCRDVSSFVKANRALEKRNLFLGGLSRLHTLWLTDSQNTHEVFNELLNVALACSDSAFGFIGEVLHSSNGSPYMKAHAISDISWDSQSREIYERAVLEGFEFRNLDTLFGCVLRTSEAIISNDPANDPRSGGTPKGHPPLKSFVGMPIKSGGVMIGMIGLANRPGGYSTQTIEELEPLLLTYSSMIVALRANREWKEAEENLRSRTLQLASANEELADASRMKDRFLASMSHELRTPLSGILNMSEALVEQFYGPLNEKQLDYLKTISDCGNHLLSLINDILDLAKIDAGQTQLRPEYCSAREVCEYALRMIEGSRALKDQTVAMRIDDGDFQFVADHRRLAQILVNLLGNAVKFTEQGGSIELVAYKDAGNKVARFTVKDSGIGFPEEQVESLFEPFIQLEDGHSRRFAGTGLGLALVRKLVELHGGGVRARNRERGGSRFEIEIPLVTPGEFQESDGSFSSPGAIASFSRTMAEPMRDRRNVLLVEDNPTNIETISDYLAAKGHTVHTAGNGKEGVALASELKPDIVLMDIQMPVMDGLEAIRRIRRNLEPDISGMPIIALTALAMASDRDACLEAGATKYLSKPIKLHELSNLIDECTLSRD